MMTGLDWFVMDAKGYFDPALGAFLMDAIGPFAVENCRFLSFRGAESAMRFAFLPH
jgi:hypothetical protein